MNILIVGAGKVGRTVAEMLSADGHELTLVDTNRKTLDTVADSLDVICVEGSATSVETLRDAGAAEADLALAITQKDEVNMVCGIMAARLGADRVIARVRDPEYLKQAEFLRETLGLTMLVNPEYECAKEISRMLRFPGDVRVDAFSKSTLEIAKYQVTKGSPLDGVQLKDIPRTYGTKVLIGIVVRGEEAIIPNGDFILHAGDRLNITGEAKNLKKFFIATGQADRPVHKVMIMGGGRVSVYLTRMLEESGIDVTVLEQSEERCSQLCDLIPNATVILGDATKSDVLDEEGLRETDAFIALTGDDGDNVITSMYVKNAGVPRVITKVNREQYGDMLENAGLSSVVSPKDIVAQQITGYARAMSGSVGGSMESLHKLADGKVEVLEFKVAPDSRLIGIPLRELPLKPGILIAALIRGQRSIIPDGSCVIEPGDHAVISTTAGRLRALDDILMNH